ncbi:MAG: hypothetical protein K0S29_94 [Gammaproteobacteria bacterium]|nr:hypothetical protein [Gammaproteobacteria bacterium]
MGEYLLSSGNRNQILLESKVGESSLLAKDNRCKVTSYDKAYCNDPASTYDFSASAVNKDINTSLQELHTSYLDIVFIHLGPAPEKVLGNGETVAELNSLYRSFN